MSEDLIKEIDKIGLEISGWVQTMFERPNETFTINIRKLILDVVQKQTDILLVDRDKWRGIAERMAEQIGFSLADRNASVFSDSLKKNREELLEDFRRAKGEN